MSNFKDKSLENLDSANILVQDNKHCASIHCFYYSCLQLSKHLLKHSCNIDYKDHMANAKLANQGSHNYVIYRLAEDIEKHSDEIDKLNYLEHINKLKTYRERADYSEEKIGPRFSRKTQSECDEILTLLKKVYYTII